jgi:hypothetical protein
MTGDVTRGSLACAILVALCAGCGGSGAGGASVGPITEPVEIQVTGSAESSPKEGCFLFLSARVVGGGDMRYCLEKFTGEPGPNAVVKDSGAMTFVLPDGTLRARVRITQTFEPDGRHAEQKLTGTVTSGTGRFAGARGTISGGGSVDEHPPGQIADSDLRYTVALEG